MPDVKWERTLVAVDVYYENEEGSHPRELRFSRIDEQRIIVMRSGRDVYYLPPELIEAIYDLHNEVPR